MNLLAHLEMKLRRFAHRDTVTVPTPVLAALVEIARSVESDKDKAHAAQLLARLKNNALGVVMHGSGFAWLADASNLLTPALAVI
jgi:hypothetical protein